jgi:DNA repair protein RadD
VIEFRDYQESAIQSARTAMARGVKRVLLNSATGSGKTVIAAGIVQRAVAKGKRVLFLAHRRELIEQCCNKLMDGGVLNFGVIMAGNRMLNAAAPVQVASVQTLIRRELPAADLIIIDEAHRANAKSYLSILANYPGAAVLGLSATPERLDGKGLDDIFDELIVVETIPGLIERGYLIKPTCYVGPTGDLSGVKTRRGDYDEGQLAEAMDKPSLTGNIVTNWIRLARGKRTVVFAASVAHAEHLTNEFFKSGVPAATVHAGTPLAEREAIIADWRRGIVQVVANVGIFCEGFDMPELECCILARPTQSVSLYLQCCGRIMRPAPGKAGALVIDHAGCCQSHGQPHIHREWSLEGMAKKRKPADTQHVCKACGMAYEASPKLFLAELQPTLRSAFDKKVQGILGGPVSDRGMDTCPGCGAAECLVCASTFIPKLARRHIDGIAWESHASCPSCLSSYCDEVPHIINDPADPNIPDTTDDLLVPMGDETPVKVTVLNEYKRLLNEAKVKGRKRGWAYWRLRERYDETILRDCLPRHTGGWWKDSA